MKAMNKYINRRSVLVTGILAVTFFFYGFKMSDDQNFQIAKNLDIFNAIVKELDVFYVDKIDPNTLIKEGIDDMLASLDPYTEYFPEEGQDELEQMLRGTYGGVGATITYDAKSKHAMVAEPYENMPAALAGLKCGDLLMKINDTDLTGKNTEAVSKLLRGQNGTTIKITVKRPGTDKLLEFNVVRRSILLPPIPYYGVVADHIGYINISTFSGSPSKDFKQSFLELKKQGITSLIIDLRNNTGGLIEEAQEIANFFLPRNKVVFTTKGRSESSNRAYKTYREPLDANIPIVVLVNGMTASSSEALTGAFQDLDRAVIIGSRTFGKGLVQAPRELPYGASIKITTSKYYIPSGRCIQAIDYNHRNADGSVEEIPDSLTHLFHTAAGRPVRDGRGILPDIVIKPKRLSNLQLYLEADNYMFNYATQYCLKHPKIAPASDFQITDADYNAFKETVKHGNFKYDEQSAKILKALKEAAEFEGYYKEATPEFNALQKKLTHNLEHDLNYFAKDIRSEINTEIVLRYYYQRGKYIQQLKNDDNLEAAIKLFRDMPRYRQILKIK